MRIQLRRAATAIIGVVGLLVSTSGFAKDVCVKHVSILEEGTIATIEAPVEAKEATPASDDKSGEAGTTEVAPPVFEINYGDDKTESSELVESSDAKTKSGLVDYGDEGKKSDLIDYGDDKAPSDLVDYGDKKGSGQEDLVFRADKAQDVAKPADANPMDALLQEAGVKSPRGSGNKYDNLIAGAMGADAEVARLFQMIPTSDGFLVRLEDLKMKVLQMPPPKTMAEAFGNLAKSGDAHVRMDLVKGKKPSNCIPAKWSGNVLSLITKSGHFLNLEFAGAKKVKGNLGGQKGIKRRVYKFNGPMNMSVKAKK